MIKRFISTTGILLCLIIIFSSAGHLKSAGKDGSIYGGKSSKYSYTKVDLSMRCIGDIDGNGTVDVDDALTLQRHAARFTFAEAPLIDENNKDMMRVADINCDSIISVGDATLIQQIVIENIVVDSENHEWAQTSKVVCDYLANVDYDPSDYSYSVIQNFAPAQPLITNEQPSGAVLNTNGGTIDRAGYTMDIKPGDITVYNDIPNTATRYTVSQNGSVKQIGMLKPAHFLRQIKCVSARNVRDLGGWSCDGGTVKYGMLFRGSAPKAVDREILVNQCGIRTEIELRGMSDPAVVLPDKSYLGNDLDYYKFPRYTWYSLDDVELWQMILRATFDSITNGKPAYFHCAVGADRTGTLACILEALLGMDPSDIDKEYELTSFCTGTDSDDTARRRNENEWIGLVSKIRSKAPANSKNPMRDGAIQFALDIGFSIDDINSFRAAMINGTPELLTVK